MESKLNYKAIEAYAEEYSSILCNELYQDKENLSGDDILKIHVSQVGLFVLNRIYQTWALEAEKLKSPFFNYQNEKVQLSLQKLMNVLSKNISVEKVSLKKVLSTAVNDTLVLIISPYSYYHSLLENTNLEILRATEKFTVINKSILSKIVSKGSTSEGLLNQPTQLLNDVFNDITEEPHNVTEELKKFAVLLHHNEKDFYLEEEEKLTGRVVLEEEEDEEVQTESTLNDAFDEGSYQTVADTLSENQQLTTLKSMLSINQKFMFINDLFNDNPDDFNKVLDFLESCEDLDSANSFIHNNYLKNNVWKVNAPQVKEFLSLLEKKFAIQ